MNTAYTIRYSLMPNANPKCAHHSPQTQKLSLDLSIYVYLNETTTTAVIVVIFELSFF